MINKNHTRGRRWISVYVLSECSGHFPVFFNVSDPDNLLLRSYYVKGQLRTMSRKLGPDIFRSLCLEAASISDVRTKQEYWKLLTLVTFEIVGIFFCCCEEHTEISYSWTSVNYDDVMTSSGSWTTFVRKGTRLDKRRTFMECRSQQTHRELRVVSNCFPIKPKLTSKSAEQRVYQCYKMFLDPYKEQYCM